MNWKKFFVAFVAAFVFIFVFGFVWYGILMNPIHHEVPSLFGQKQTSAIISVGWYSVTS